MNRIILIAVAVLLASAGLASGADEIDAEMLPLVEQVKSSNPTTRAEAVNELVALRAAVSEKLRQIVRDADEGRVLDVAKASALYLMGELHLLDCRDTLEAHVDWQHKPIVRGPEDRSKYRANIASMVRSTFFARGFAAESALGRIGKNDMATVESSVRRADLSAYPVLEGALNDYYILDLDRREEIQEAEECVLRWYEVVTRGMRSVLGTSPYYNSSLYDDEVKAAAVWLLGEYRDIHAGRQLALNIDLRDEAGVTGNFTGRIGTGTQVSSEYPVAVAILKIGSAVKRDLERFARSHERYKMSAEGAARLRQLADLVSSDGS